MNRMISGLLHQTHVLFLALSFLCEGYVGSTRCLGSHEY